MRDLLPSFDDFRSIGTTWRLDLVAGITVGIVALPLALAFGVSSGVGATAGLVTAIVAGFVAAVFGGSHVQVSGPTGAMVVVLAPVVATHGPGSVALIAILAGLILLVAAMFGLGRSVDVIPWPVIEGFGLGIAIIIGAQQLPAALGTTSTVGRNAVVAASESIGDPGSHWPWALGTVSLVVVVMAGSRAISPRLPGSLLAVAVTTVLAQAGGAPLPTIGALPHALPPPSVPAAGWDSMQTLGTAALAVAALAAIESLLSAKVAGTLADVGRLQPDRELVGQGLASIAAGLFGGMPATGAIARTAVNISAGGRSRLAAITHAAMLLLVVYTLAGLVSRIPLAALAGVLLVVAARMVDLRAARALLRSGRSTALIYVLTATVTVAFDLVNAVIIGVVVAAFFALRQFAADSRARREPLPGRAEPGDERIALFTLNGSMFFAAADRVLDEVLSVGGLQVAILRMSQVTMLDATGARRLGELVTALERRGVTVLIKGMRDQDMRLASTVGVIGSLRHHRHLFTELEPAIAHARSHIRRQLDESQQTPSDQPA